MVCELYHNKAVIFKKAISTKLCKGYGLAGRDVCGLMEGLQKSGYSPTSFAGGELGPGLAHGTG